MFNLELLLTMFIYNNSFAFFLIKPSHPRILIKSDEIPSLRHRCKEIEPFKQAYMALKNRVDSWRLPTENRYLIGYEIQAIVFTCIIEDYTQPYPEKLHKWIENFFENQRAVNLALSKDPGTIWGSADIILGLSMAYDWLYPILSTKRRRLYGTYLRDFQKAVLLEQGGMKRDASRSDYSNQFYYFDSMIAVTGIALYQDGIDDLLSLTYLNTFDNYVHNHMLPTINQVGGMNGGWHEGLGYVDRAMTYFSLVLEVWRVGANEDLFPLATGLRNLNKWLLYSTQPDGNLVNIGDVSDWPRCWGPGEGRRAVLLSSRYNDSFSQYIIKKIDLFNSKNWPLIIFYLLWYNPNIKEVYLHDLETAMHFDGIGWVSMRSSWNKNATFAIFHSGNFYFSHQHLDQNSFIIFKNKPLVIDSGIYNLGAPNYKWATRFHNTILIGDPGPINSLHDGDAGQTGASPMFYVQDPENSNTNKGTIILFENRENYTYIIGDASRAYNEKRLSIYIRKFLFIRPDYFIVLDRILLPVASYPIRWLLQSETPPAISKNGIKITNGSGRLFCKILLPESVTISMNTISYGEPKQRINNYRIEIVPTKRNKEEYYLTFLSTSDRLFGNAPPLRLITSLSGNLVGCLFNNHVILMVKNLSSNKMESYYIPHTASKKLLTTITDLVPNKTYEVHCDGKFITRKMASPGGVLQFQTTRGGNFDIALTD